MQIYYNEMKNEIILNKKGYADDSYSTQGLFDEKYPLGHLLVEYVELDFETIMQKLNDDLELPLPDNDADIQINISKIIEFYSYLANLHPYFYQLDPEVEELISESYIPTLKKYVACKTALNNDDSWFNEYNIKIFQENNPDIEILPSGIKRYETVDYKKEIMKTVKFCNDWIKRYELLFKAPIKHYQNTSADYKNAIKFCLDTDCPIELKDLSTLQRYYLYEKYIKKSIRINQIEVKYKANSIEDEGLGNDISKTCESPDLADLLKLLPQDPIKLYEVYETGDISSACFIEFIKLVAKGVSISRCKNCNRYFINVGRSDAKYCERPVGNDGKNCKDVGAINLYRAKTKNDPIIEEYNRAYKRRFAQVKYKKLSQRDFEEWSREAKLMKDKAKSGKLSAKDFKDWLGNK